MGVREGAVYLTAWHAPTSKVPQPVRDRVAKVTEMVRTGQIDVDALAGKESK